MQDYFDKIKIFCLEYKKYFGAAALFLAFVLVLNHSGQPDVSKNKREKVVGNEATEILADDTETDTTEAAFTFDKEFEVDSDEKITELLKAYYAAYTSNNIKELEKVAYPISDNEKSYIEVLSKYYKKISKFSYYSKEGLAEGSYFVSVSNEIKFDGIKATAPALDFFYIETDEKGNLYINNAYSIFNLNFMENQVDSEIYALVQRYMQQSDFVVLQQQIQSKYDEVLTQDKDLAEMIQNKLDSAIKEWAAAMQKAITDEGSAEQGTEKTEDSGKDQKPDKTDSKNKEDKTEDEQVSDHKPKEETPKEETEQEETPKEEIKEEESNGNEGDSGQKTTVKTKDVVNVRAAASTDSQQLGQFLEGAELTKIGEEGEWTVIEFRGGKGYIKTEFLE